MALALAMCALFLPACALAFTAPTMDGAVTDRESFEPEYQWQARCLASLAQAAQQRT